MKLYKKSCHGIILIFTLYMEVEEEEELRFRLGVVKWAKWLSTC